MSGVADCPANLAGGWCFGHSARLVPTSPTKERFSNAMKVSPTRRYLSQGLGLFRGYSRKNLSGDVTAGIAVALIALPIALAIGAASLPSAARTPFPAPAIGIFTAVIAGFIVSLLGGSPVQISGPGVIVLPILPLVVERYGFDGLMLATIMAGAILAFIGLTGMGAMIKLIPLPVTSGLASGIAISVMVSQAPDFLGISVAEPAPREFLERVAWLWTHIPDINPEVAAIGFACVLLIVFWPRLRLRRIPGALVSIVFAGFAIALLGTQHAEDVSTIGTRFGANAIPLKLPPFTVPLISLARIRALIAPALTIALLGSMESLLSASMADGLIRSRHNSKTELIAQGAANMVSPFFCGLPSMGAVSRTFANIRFGGSTPLAGLIQAASLFLLAMVFSRLAQFVPMASVAAVLIILAYSMGEWNELGRLFRMPRRDAVALVTILLTTVLFDLSAAVEVAMVFAAFLLVGRTKETSEAPWANKSHGIDIDKNGPQEIEVPSDALIYSISAPSYFAAAEKMEDAAQGISMLPRVLVLRMESVGDMDSTALNALGSIVERMKKTNGLLVLSGATRQALQTLVRTGLFDTIGRANVVPSVADALLRARETNGQNAQRER